MKAKLIIMLTYNDQTVQDAIDIFNSCKDLPITHWGFKNIGLPAKKMKKLIKEMKNAGKTTFLEVVTYTENECLLASKIAIKYQFDYLMGTIYYDSVFKLLKDKHIKYFPFCGKVTKNPSVLEGSVSEIINSANKLEKLGVNGLDILAYRYVGNANELLREFVKKVNIPIIIAGSINNYDRIDNVDYLNPWGFTMGSALFDKEFIKNGSFRDNLEKVLEYINKKL